MTMAEPDANDIVPPSPTQVKNANIKWSSPWITLICRDNHHLSPPYSSSLELQQSSEHEGEEVGENDDVIELEVPETGWYAFYFGVDKPLLLANSKTDYKNKQQQQKNKNTQNQKTEHNDDYDHDGTCPTPATVADADEKNGVATFITGFCLAITPPPPLSRNQNAKDEEEMKEEPSLPIEIPLPLREGHLVLASCHVGKLIYIDQGAKVRVLHKLQQKDQQVQNEKKDIKIPKEHGVNKDMILCFWRLWFHRFPERQGRGANPDNSNDAMDDRVETTPSMEKSEDRPVLGTLAEAPQRRFSCYKCRQCFHSCNAVRHHMDVRHVVTDTNNETTPPPSGGTAMENDATMLWSRPLHILYEDDCLAVIDKPQGMAVQGSKETLLRSNLLLPLKGIKLPEWPDNKTNIYNTADCTSSDNENLPKDDDAILGKPRPVHRLDAPTGGILVVAKTRRSEALLKQAFRERTIHKVYRSVVYGRLETAGTCQVALSNKSAMTHYQPLRYLRSLTSHDGWYTVVELEPVTGRQHQLRKHMQRLGHSIVGDLRYSGVGGHKLYSPINSNTAEHVEQRLCLWAMQITFPHPLTGHELTVRLEQEPEWIAHVTALEEARWNRYHEQEQK